MADQNLSRRHLLKIAGGAIAATIIGTDASQAITTGPDIQHGDRKKPNVALTFHGAGDLSIAREILAIAKEKKASITVMAIGAWLDANPAIGKEIIDAGHELGNHTLNHKTMPRLSFAQAKSEILGGKAALAKILGTKATYFRPSGTQFSNATIRRAVGLAGYKNCISYDVDTLDYQDPAATAIVKNCMKAVKNGSIVSLHLGHANTVKALPMIIDQLQAKGLTPATLTGLLGAP